MIASDLAELARAGDFLLDAALQQNNDSRSFRLSTPVKALSAKRRISGDSPVGFVLRPCPSVEGIEVAARLVTLKTTEKMSFPH